MNANSGDDVFMIKKILVFLIVLMFVTMSTISAETVNNEHKNAPVLDIPTQSRFVDLGNGMVRYDSVHYAKNIDHANQRNKPSADDDDENYEYLLMGTKWINSESFVVNPTGYGGNDMQSVVETSLHTWGIVTGFELFGSVSEDDSIAQGYIYDGTNSVTFADFDNPRAIAVACTWYNRFTYEIVESDVVFNTEFTWGNASTNPDVMDLQNIATHEFGHSAGLLDIYTPELNYLTMYGYGTEGETKKRTLAPGDIAGIHAIYGD